MRFGENYLFITRSSVFISLWGSSFRLHYLTLVIRVGRNTNIQKRQWIHKEGTQLSIFINEFNDQEIPRLFTSLRGVGTVEVMLTNSTVVP